MRTSNSAFYFGIVITDSNRFLCFDEGNGELIASLRPGKYTPTGLMNEVARAMNEVAEDGVYTSELERYTRLLTISADISFDLLIATGSSAASVFSTLGFTGADQTGLDAYTGSGPVGLSYRPQFRLQSWVEFEHNQKAVDSTVNVSASGQVELVRFGRFKLMEAEITFATDIFQPAGGPIMNNPNGISDLQTFMEYATEKGPMEFIPDVTNPEVFNNCILESTPESPQGVDFKIKELIARNLSGYFTTGILIFREVSL